MLGESSVYNVLAEGMYFLENVFLYKSSRSNFNFLDFECLSEVVSIPRVIFETTSQFFYKLAPLEVAPFCNVLVKTCKV